MRDQLESRLKELKSEFEVGQNKLAELETQAANLRNMLLRISGAIQVLEEELDKAAPLPQFEPAQRVPSGNGTA
jgi:predicted nuclease with TOPRIM domain